MRRNEIRSGNRGFTLVEMLIVVAIIIGLSVIAGGAYRKYLDNARKSEVYAVLAEIRTKQEAYRAEFSQYLGGTESAPFPTLGSCGKEPCSKYVNPANGASPPTWWSNLNVNAGRMQVYCSYAVVAGCSGASCSNSTTPSGSFGGPSFSVVPSGPWWYAVVTCDNDGQPTKNAIFVTTSESNTVFEQDIHF